MSLLDHNPIRVAFVSCHPVPYHTPLYREVSAAADIDAVVLYQDNFGLKSSFVPEFNTSIEWDIPLLNGYRCCFLRNYSPTRWGGFFSRINPGLVWQLLYNRYDVVVVHGYATLSDWLAIGSAKIAGSKLILKGEAVLRTAGRESRLKMWFKKQILRRLVHLADAVMYSCTGNRVFFEHYGATRERLFPLPCAVDNDFFQTAHQRCLNTVEKTKRRIHIGKDEFIILFSARLTARKRPSDLVEAVAKLSNTNATILFVGNGPEKQSLERLCRERGVRAYFSGFLNQSELAEYYSICDIYAICSEYDPSPKTLNEAMNFELPIICTSAIGTSSDLVRPGENGFIYEAGDITALTEHLRTLSEDPVRRRAMGRLSLRIVKNWTFKVGASSLLNAIKSIVRDKCLTNVKPS